MGKIINYEDTEFIQFDLQTNSVRKNDIITIIGATACVLTNNGDMPAEINGKYLLGVGASVSFSVEDDNVIKTQLKINFVTGGAGTNPRVDIAQLQSSKFNNYA